MWRDFYESNTSTVGNMVALRIPDIASFLFNEITKWYSFDETLIYKYLFPNGAELQYKKIE